MMRSRACGLLALLFLLTLVLGNLLPRATNLPFAASLLAAPQAPTLVGGAQPSAPFPEFGIEPVSPRPMGQTKRDRESGGDEPVLLPTLLVVAIALFYALPLRGSDVVRTLRIGLTPEGRHREAGRCPTGPPGQPC